MLEYSSRAHAPTVPHDLTLEVDNHDDCSGRLSGKTASSFAECVLWEISGLILSREALKQFALSMMMGRPHVSLYCKQKKTLAVTAIAISYVCGYEWDTLNDKANKMLTKSKPEKTLAMGEKYLCKKLEGRAFARRGRIFESYSTIVYLSIAGRCSS